MKNDKRVSLYNLTEMLTKLFGRRKVVIGYFYNSDNFEVTVDGKVLDDTLQEIIDKYNYLVFNEPKLQFKSYEEMNEIVEREELCIYIYPELYEWTRA